jgi:hypothetical protein
MYSARKIRFAIRLSRSAWAAPSPAAGPVEIPCLDW